MYVHVYLCVLHVLCIVCTYTRIYSGYHFNSEYIFTNIHNMYVYTYYIYCVCKDTYVLMPGIGCNFQIDYQCTVTRGGWTRVTQSHVTPIPSIENLGPDSSSGAVRPNFHWPKSSFAMAVSLKLVQCGFRETAIA